MSGPFSPGYGPGFFKSGIRFPFVVIKGRGGTCGFLCNLGFGTAGVSRSLGACGAAGNFPWPASKYLNDHRKTKGLGKELTLSQARNFGCSRDFRIFHGRARPMSVLTGFSGRRPGRAEGRQFSTEKVNWLESLGDRGQNTGNTAVNFFPAAVEEGPGSPQGPSVLRKRIGGTSAARRPRACGVRNFPEGDWGTSGDKLSKGVSVGEGSALRIFLPWAGEWAGTGRPAPIFKGTAAANCASNAGPRENRPLGILGAPTICRSFGSGA